MNPVIRKQRIRNEWFVGLVPSRLWAFMGHWSIEGALFPVAYRVTNLLVNLYMGRNGMPPVKMERKLERLDLYKRDEV